MILPHLPIYSLMEFNLVWIFLFNRPINLAKGLLQSASIHNKTHLFKEWKLHQTIQSRALFVQARSLCSKAINYTTTSFIHRINNKIALYQIGSRSFWSLGKVISLIIRHSSFPPLQNNSGSSLCTPSFKTNLFASTFASNSNLDDQEPQLPPYRISTISKSPIKFSTCKVRKISL